MIAPPPPRPGAGSTRRKLPGALLALFGLLWFGIAQELAARAATGFASQWFAGMLVPLLRPAFLLFLLGLGLVLLEGGSRGADNLTRISGLVRRPGASREWALGAAVGWGAAALATLPLVLGGHLLLTFWTAPRGWVTAAICVVSAAMTTLASEVAFRSYAFRRLAESVGKTAAVLLISLVYAISVGLEFGRGRVVWLAFFFAVLLAAGWLRSHALWISWGVHFAWNVSLGLLFGLQAFDGGDLSSVVQGQVRGRSHWIGGPLGPIGAWWTLPALAIALAVLLRVTRDYAWRYTHAPIVAAGYPMEARPPAAHTAMEQAGMAAAAPLVQILASTPTTTPQGPPPRHSDLG